jgi:hypothetical protein
MRSSKFGLERSIRLRSGLHLSIKTSKEKSKPPTLGQKFPIDSNISLLGFVSKVSDMSSISRRNLSTFVADILYTHIF